VVPALAVAWIVLGGAAAGCDADPLAKTRHEGESCDVGAWVANTCDLPLACCVTAASGGGRATYCAPRDECVPARSGQPCASHDACAEYLACGLEHTCACETCDLFPAAPTITDGGVTITHCCPGQCVAGACVPPAPPTDGGADLTDAGAPTDG
jgi:hypothetical protein